MVVITEWGKRCRDAKESGWAQLDVVVMQRNMAG